MVIVLAMAVKMITAVDNNGNIVENGHLAGDDDGYDSGRDFGIVLLDVSRNPRID